MGMGRTTGSTWALAAGVLLLAAFQGAERQGGDHDNDATVRHGFEDPERWARVFDDPARDEWQRPAEVLDFLGVAAGQRIADLGAGTGYFTVRLAEAVGPDGRVYAVDVEPSMVDYVARRCADAGTGDVVVPILAEPDDPGLDERSVDTVLVVDTWHHIDDRLAYLERLAGSLRPGGRVAVVDWREGKLPVGPPVGHKLSRGAVVEEFGEGGWELVAEKADLPYQYVLVFAPPQP